MTAPTPSLADLPRVAWVIAQALGCIACGAWVGQSVAPGVGEFVGGSAFAFFAALMLSFLVGRKVAMLFGLAQFGLRGAQRLRRGHALEREAGRERDRRDERRVTWIAVAVAALAFGLLATAIAVVLWCFAEDASLFAALLRAWISVVAMAGLMPWALPAMEDVQSGPPP
jgi:FtsH-binding integral membrane protein